jgi:CelD/BcsL family acetyltransferase involved in cellulose biosynthesis
VRWLAIALFTVVSAGVSAQGGPPSSPPQMRLNIVNVCTPNEGEEKQIAAALARMPERPVFSSDFEIARGHTTDKQGAADWVRLRREFVPDTPFSNVQFMLTISGGSVEESLVLHAKANQPGEPLQISLENEVTQGGAAEVLRTDTPPSRIRLERFGKPSLVLARCPQTDQKAYDSLFRTAAERFARYRAALDVRGTVAPELARLKSAPARQK